MSYRLSPEDAASITDVELAFSTTRLLPPWAQVPEAFRRGNGYTEMVSDLFIGRLDGDRELEIREGYTDQMVARTVQAHLKAFEPKHEHKIAGVGYMLSLMAELPGA